MSDRSGLLPELLEAWRYAREGFIAEAENIAPDRWTFRPTPENRDVAEIVRHILEASLMAIGEVSRPDGDFTRQGFEEHIREHAAALPAQADRQEWIALLRSTLEEGCDRLEALGSEGILQPIRQFNGQPATRLTWFHHHIAHEDYHRGQVALYARLTGAVPALTQMIHGS